MRTDKPTSSAQLELIACDVAVQAADHIRANYGRATSLGTKSSATDVVTQTDIDSETLIRRLLTEASGPCGFIGEEGETTGARESLQWVIDPLDGTVNFLYSVPIFSVSIAAAVDGEFVAGAVVDVMRAEVFSGSLGNGARLNGVPIHGSACTALANALVATGFSYTPRLRAVQGEIVRKLLPVARDVRCFGSAAIQLAWVACGRIDAYFERDIKIWDWAAGALIASESGAVVEYPCPENEGLVSAAGAAIVGQLREHTAVQAIQLD
jgi:myo-inositol-1(or 4)-monophosphatase